MVVHACINQLQSKGLLIMTKEKAEGETKPKGVEVKEDASRITLIKKIKGKTVEVSPFEVEVEGYVADGWKIK